MRLEREHVEEVEWKEKGESDAPRGEMHEDRPQADVRESEDGSSHHSPARVEVASRRAALGLGASPVKRRRNRKPATNVVKSRSMHATAAALLDSGGKATKADRYI